MKIDIDKDYIKVDNEIFYFKNIKNIEFKENKLNDKIMYILLGQLSGDFVFLLMIIPIFFIVNWITILLSIIGVLIIVAKINYTSSYEIFIGLKKIYSSNNREEFEDLKEKILNR